MYRAPQDRKTGRKLLLDEYPLIILPSLALEVGLEEAVVLQQVHFWLESGQGAEAEGQRWIYNSYTKWQAQFPFWSVQKVERIIRSLEEQGWLLSGSFNKLAMDKTKWYRPDYEKLGQPFPASGKPSLTSGKGVPASGKPIPETTTEITSEKRESVYSTGQTLLKRTLSAFEDAKIPLKQNQEQVLMTLCDKVEALVGPLAAPTWLKDAIDIAAVGDRPFGLFDSIITEAINTKTRPQKREGREPVNPARVRASHPSVRSAKELEDAFRVQYEEQQLREMHR